MNTKQEHMLEFFKTSARLAGMDVNDIRYHHLIDEDVIIKIDNVDEFSIGLVAMIDKHKNEFTALAKIVPDVVRTMAMIVNEPSLVLPAGYKDTYTEVWDVRTLRRAVQAEMDDLRWRDWDYHAIAWALSVLNQPFK